MISDQNQNNIISFILLIIIVIGVFGNTMNIIIFSTKTMRKNSTFKYLFYLSIIDLLVLLICSTDSMLAYTCFIMIRLKSDLACKFQTFLVYFLTHLSSFILMVVNINRVLVIKNQESKKSKESNTNFRMNKHGQIIKSLCLLLALCNSHYLIFLNRNLFEYKNKSNENETMIVLNFYSKLEERLNKSVMNLSFNYSRDVKLIFKRLIDDSDLGSISQRNLLLRYYEKYIQKNVNSTINMCYPTEKSHYHFFLSYIWVWIDMVIFSLLPFTVMIICSFLIIHEIFNKSKNFLKSNDKSNRNTLKKSKKRNRQLLIMLTVTNLFFLLCSLPLCIHIILSKTKTVRYQRDLLLNLFQTISYSNNSFSFLFYWLFSENYRRVFVFIFLKRSKEPTQIKPSLTKFNFSLTMNSSKHKNLKITASHSNKIAMPSKALVRFNEENFSLESIIKIK